MDLPHDSPPLTASHSQDYDSFQHDVYGDTITVERRIVPGGASSYLLKDSSGRWGRLLPHFHCSGQSSWEGFSGLAGALQLGSGQ